MIGRPCVACDEVSIGARDGFDLCREHWNAVEAEDQTRAAEAKRNARREAQARFRKAYPHIAITASEVEQDSPDNNPCGEPGCAGFATWSGLWP